MTRQKADVFAAISDPTRRHILFLLAAGSLNIHLLAGNFDISRPAVSKHIKILEEAGLVSIEEKGRKRYCSLDQAGFGEIRDWLAFYDQFWTNNLSRLGRLLKEKNKPKNNKHKKP